MQLTPIFTAKQSRSQGGVRTILKLVAASAPPGARPDQPAAVAVDDQTFLIRRTQPECTAVANLFLAADHEERPRHSAVAGMTSSKPSAPIDSRWPSAE